MRNVWVLPLVSLSAVAWCGQPVERFRLADHFTFSHGSAEARYGNADATTTITMQVTILGQQVFTNPSSAAEARINKTSGSLNFSLKLSDFDPTLPPDTITFVGADLGGDLLKHTTDSVLPGPYVVNGTFNGTAVNLTLSNVRVTGTLFSQGSNTITPPWLNAVLGEVVDVQMDDSATNSNNFITAIPANVSGWVVSPFFTVKSMRIETTGIRQAGQVPAQVVVPDAITAQLGNTTSGTVADLATLDGTPLRVCKGFVPNVLVDPVRVEFKGAQASVPQYLSLWAVGKMATVGAFRQKLELFDYTTNSFSSVDTRSDVVNTTSAAFKLDATGDLSRYVGPGGEVRARYGIKQTGFTAAAVWCYEQDQFVWFRTP